MNASTLIAVMVGCLLGLLFLWGLYYFFPQGHEKFDRYKTKWATAKKNDAPDRYERFLKILECDYEYFSILHHYDLNEKEEKAWLNHVRNYARNNVHQWYSEFRRLYFLYKNMSLNSKIREELFDVLFSLENDSDSAGNWHLVFFHVLSQSKGSILDENGIETVDREMFFAFGKFSQVALTFDHWKEFAEKLQKEGCTILGAKKDFPTFINPTQAGAYATIIKKKMAEKAKAFDDLYSALKIFVEVGSANDDVRNTINSIMPFLNDVERCSKVIRLIRDDARYGVEKEKLFNEMSTHVAPENYEENLVMSRRSIGEDVFTKHFDRALKMADKSGESTDLRDLFYDFYREDRAVGQICRDKVLSHLVEPAQKWTQKEWKAFEKLNGKTFYVILRDKIRSSAVTAEDLEKYEYFRKRSNNYDYKEE